MKRKNSSLIKKQLQQDEIAAASVASAHGKAGHLYNKVLYKDGIIEELEHDLAAALKRSTEISSEAAIEVFYSSCFHSRSNMRCSLTCIKY